MIWQTAQWFKQKNLAKNSVDRNPGSLSDLRGCSKKGEKRDQLLTGFKRIVPLFAPKTGEKCAFFPRFAADASSSTGCWGAHRGLHKKPALLSPAFYRWAGAQHDAKPSNNNNSYLQALVQPLK